MTAIRLLAALCAFSAVCSQAETAYISDELTIPLRSGPSGQHRILHAGLPSGTKLEILSANDTAGFSEIRTERGTQGWVRTQYLVNEPIAKLRLAAAQRELLNLRNRLNRETQRVQELSSNNQDQASTNQQNQNRINALESELEEIKRISANAIAAHEENLNLNETNARLRDELDDLSEERNRLADNAQNQAIMIGAGLILLGLLAGVMIKSRPQRSAWN